MGVCWIIIATFSIFHVVYNQRRSVTGDIGSFGIPFSLAYWGLIFPNGVFAVLCVQLAKVLNSSFFRVLGAIWSSK
jgi:tellurite resistance protein TehA-like permease